MKKNQISVIFLHGLLGDPGTSWGATSAFLNSDAELKGHFRADFFRYAAGLAAWLPVIKYLPWVRNWPVFRRAIRIQDVALGLGTHIDTVHGPDAPLVLVGHSMGGLVIREYLLNELAQGRGHRIKSALLFAVPNKGANLAALGERLNLTSKQIRQLAPDSDYIENLNRRWKESGIEEQIAISCVAALLDGIVGKDSALLSSKVGRAHYLHEDSHISCIKPATIDSVSYQLIRTAIANAVGSKNTSPAGPPDPLFFMYDLQCEPYYIEREIDRSVAKQIDSGIWVHGPSGVGKTNCMLRNSLFRNHRVVYLSVANHKGAQTAAEVVRSLAMQIVHRASGEPAGLPPENSDAIGWMLDVLRQRFGATTLTVLLDEVPDDECVLTGMARFVMTAVLAEKMNGRASIRFAFSSLFSPSDLLPEEERRLLEVIRPAQMDKWDSVDIRRLVERLCHSISIPVSKEEVDRICSASGGDPRYVKNVFRELSIDTEKRLDRALAAVQAEQAQSLRGASGGLA
ncbi:esterase/lipase family protein [Reyranella sp.]|uniref:esterase/lipase family protein n=1 Tax=Reyranella sp. TaxID=1929291 RepID=UPI0040363E6D